MSFGSRGHVEVIRSEFTSLSLPYPCVVTAVVAMKKHMHEVVDFGSFHIMNFPLQFGPVAEAQQEGVL